MRLVIDGRRLGRNRTGVGRYLEGLLEEWADSGPPLPETLVVLHDASAIGQVPRAKGVESRLVCEGWPGLAWERFGLGRVLRPGDLLFAPTNLAPANWKGSTVLVAFDTLQEVVPESFPRLVRWRFGPRYRHAAQTAKRVLVPSQSTARDVQRFYGVEPRKIRVIPPAPVPAFRPISPGSDAGRNVRDQLGLGDRPFFLFLGKRSRRRNTPAILEAFHQFRRDHSNMALIFAGPHAGGDDLGANLAERGILDLGHVAESVLPTLLSEAIALLYPSNYEGFGLPISEAMACGCPVLTLRNSALSEAGGEAAIYLDSADPEAIRKAMQGLIDPGFRGEHAKRGLAWVSRWSRRQFADSVKTELLEVAGSGTKGG